MKSIYTLLLKIDGTKYYLENFTFATLINEAAENLYAVNVCGFWLRFMIRIRHF